MKILGHPLHVMLVHFPAALLPVDLLCSLIARYNVLPYMDHAAFYAGAAGCAIGWLALFTGAADLLYVAREKQKSLNKALLHGGINALVIMGFSVTSFIGYKHFPELDMSSTMLLMGKFFLVALMLVGNYFGGSLILNDGIGVKAGSEQ